MKITVERFHDPRYSRQRYRLRYGERQTSLIDGYTCGSYKFKRDAEMRADELTMGAAAARAKRDGRYRFVMDRDFHNVPWRVAVYFCGERVGHAPNLDMAYAFAGEHTTTRIGETP